MRHQLKILRVYELEPDMEGYRILVDRLWPRGLCKEALVPFVWAKNIAPTNELRKWFGHDPERYEEFTQKYQKELNNNPHAEKFVKDIENVLEDQDVILLYAAKNKEINQAIVLKKWLEERLKR
ncbi:MAG: DUF488 family protein [Eubacteriales bacterium]|jgi:uncharacterized protein YeaO (DUF488 family)